MLWRTGHETWTTALPTSLSPSGNCASRLRLMDARSEAVRNFSLDVQARECVGLIGASGAGKSTILNAIGGFIAPTSGEVIVNGFKVTAPGADRGVVFQTHNLFPWKTVLQNVEFGPRMRGESRRSRRLRCAELLSAVGGSGILPTFIRRI